MEKILNSDIIKIFHDSEIYTGTLNEKDNHTYNVLYRCKVYQSNFVFLLFDYKHLYYCSSKIDEVVSQNKELNPSLEFSDQHSLLQFLLDNLIKVESGLKISKTDDSFLFEALVDIVNLQWIFYCTKMDIRTYYNELQGLFVKPLLNLLLSFGHFLSNEKNSSVDKSKNLINGKDVNSLLGSKLAEKTNFNRSLCELTLESTRRINNLTETQVDLRRKPSQVNESTQPHKENKRKKPEEVKPVEDPVIEDERSQSLSPKSTNSFNAKPLKKKKKIKFM